ncbi:MAG: hypothetical protein Kow00106_23230 [Anaerolineae bacterium]
MDHTLPMSPLAGTLSVVVAQLPGGFMGALFALAAPPERAEVALVGVVAAHTSLRALWAGIKDGSYRRPDLQVMGEAYTLPHALSVVAKGAADKAEWQLLATPGVVVADEAAVRAYAGRRWPLPPDRPLLPLLAQAYALTTVLGSGAYLDLPHPDSDAWKGIIRRVVVGDDGEEAC